MGLLGHKEFESQNRHLALFTECQESLLKKWTDSVCFKDSGQKLRYLHFMLGAIDQLSRTIKDDSRKQFWVMATMRNVATNHYHNDEAMSHLDSYGRTDKNELHSAGKRGWFAMHTFICVGNDKQDEEVFIRSCLEMYSVVNQISPEGVKDNKRNGGYEPPY